MRITPPPQQVRSGAFTRALSVPYPIDPEHVAAQFIKGILRLTLPKAESAKPRRIAIGGGEQAQLGGGTISTNG